MVELWVGGEWLVDYNSKAINFDIDNQWINDGWLSPLQLVVCDGVDQEQRLGSCGRYTRQSDGVSGEAIQDWYYEVVHMAVALTGKTLQSKTFYGSTPVCAGSLWSEIDNPTDDPPWNLHGDYPDPAAIDACRAGRIGRFIAQ